MSEVQRFVVKDSGKTVEIYVETPQALNVPTRSSPGQRPGEKGAVDDLVIMMQDAQEKVKTYTKFAIDAFNQVTEVEEITLKFGMKLSAKAGVVFTEASAEGSLEVQVKCKFKTISQKSLEAGSSL
jgi:Trypsin-co-occurring domain 1